MTGRRRCALADAFALLAVVDLGAVRLLDRPGPLSAPDGSSLALLQPANAQTDVWLNGSSGPQPQRPVSAREGEAYFSPGNCRSFIRAR